MSTPQERWKTQRLGQPVGTHWRTCRWRARQIVSDVSQCAWDSIGGCRGPIHVAHVDQDFTNNDRENLLPLCTAHHRLLDHGHIDPKAPEMPEFYTDAAGKRRYTFAPRQQPARPHRGLTRQEWRDCKTKYFNTPRKVTAA